MSGHEMKKGIDKWLRQAVSGGGLAVLVHVCFWLWGRPGAIWIWAILPISSTAGIVLGDLYPYKGGRPSVLAIGVTYVLGLVGLVIGEGVGKVLFHDLFPDHIGGACIVVWLAPLLCLVVPSLIGYNSLSFLKKRRDSNKRVNGEG